MKANAVSNSGDLAKVAAGFMQGASLFLQYAREHLDQPRPWPQGFEPRHTIDSMGHVDAIPAPRHLRQEFEQAGMDQDLKAIESGCADLPGLIEPNQKLSVYHDEPFTLSSTPRGSRGMPRLLKRKAQQRKKDFDPEGR